MSFLRYRLAGVSAVLLTASPAVASHLVTGNGFGFAVVAPATGTATWFYAHPYSFLRPDPAHPLSEGVETANFIKKLGWGDEIATPSADYDQDSHIIHARTAHGEGRFFMPFDLPYAALVISWEPPPGSTGGWRVEWNHPVTSQKVVRLLGMEMHLLKFDDIQESLLLIPLTPEASQPVSFPEPLAIQPGHCPWSDTEREHISCTSCGQIGKVSPGKLSVDSNARRPRPALFHLLCGKLSAHNYPAH